MTDELRLLEAIVAAPADDAPRLVYADWLQSRGDPRGELVLLQCQLAAAPDDDRRRNIKIAENKLLAAHQAAWLQPLYDALPKPPPHVKYEFELVRGFVEEAKITVTCLPRLARLFEHAPLLRRLRITPAGFSDSLIQQPRLGGALAAPELERLTALELSLPGGGNAVAEAVAAAATLRNLRELTIAASVWGEQVRYFDAKPEDVVLDDAGAAALANSPHLAGLEHLILDSNRLTHAGITSIAHAAWRLRSLDLGTNAIDAEGFAAALAGPALRGLEVLRLAGSVVAPRDLTAIAGGKLLSQLRELDLERCSLGAPGTAVLCKHLALPLRRLRVERNSLGDAGALALAGCAALAGLTSLEAGHNRMGHKGAKALAESPHLAKLERLTLNEPRWKPETSQLFADSATLANTRIYLEGRLLARKKKKSVAKPKR